MKKDYKKSLKYIYITECGKVSELQFKLDQETIDSFASVGFISYGYTADAKTWSITKLGKQYCEDFVL